MLPPTLVHLSFRDLAPSIFRIFLALLSNYTYAQVNWTQVSNPPLTPSLHGVCFLNPNTGRVVGDGGSVYKTTDGGVTWTLQKTLDQRGLYCIAFLDANTGVVAGENAFVEKTTDGGGVWTDRGPGGFYTVAAMCVMPSGWILACGSRCSIGRSDDGGEHWPFIDQGYPGQPDTTFAAVAALTAKTAVIVGNPNDPNGNPVKGSFYVTTNDGITWGPRGEVASDALWGVACCDNNVVVAVGGSGLIRRTTNLGSSWTNIPNHSSSLFAVTFLGAHLGFAVGAYGTILRTTDEGLTWEGQLSGVTDDLRAVQCVDSLHIVAVSAAGYVLRSNDGGLTWHRQYLGILNTFYGASADPRGAFESVGDLGVFLRSNETGSQFSFQRISPPRDLRAVAFPTPSFGIAVGLLGSVMRTVDTGATWSLLQIDSNIDLQHLAMFDSLHGVASGLDGTLLATGDGGTTWQAAARSGVQTLHCIIVSDARHGMAVGDSGIIIRTSDAGRTWISEPCPTQLDLYAVAFNGRGLGLAGGVEGTLLRTTDGGSKWVRVPLLVTSDVQEIVFFDSLRCYCICSHGTGLQSVDGGLTWNITNSYPGKSPQTLCINSRGSVFIADNGAGGFFGTAAPLPSFTRWLRVAPPFGVDENFVGMDFSDSTHGTVIHFNGTLSSTPDACNSWTTTNGGCPTGTYSFRRISAGLWETISNGAAWRTTDAGKTWVYQLPLGGISHGGVHFLDNNHGTIVADGSVWITANGGQSWTNCSPQNIDHPFGGTNFWFTNTWTAGIDTSFVVGNGGEILRTTDGGRTWNTQQQRNTSDLFQVRGNRNGVAIAVGDNGTIHRTSDHGDTWSSISSPTTQSLGGDIEFFNDDQALIVGQNGTILLTTDAGNHWTVQQSHCAVNMFNIQIVDELTAFVAGAQRTILRTTDAGNTWIVLSPADGNHLLSVACLDSNVAVAVGINGRITRTTNGGANWTGVASGTQNLLRQVLKTGSKQLICVGYGGTILRSVDEGRSWQSQSSGVSGTGYINAVTVAANGSWFAAGDVVILSSSDSGAHWVRRIDSLKNTLTAISFPTSTHGVAVGSTLGSNGLPNGVLLHSSDAGNTWNSEPLESGCSLTSIAFVGPMAAVGAGTYSYWYQIGSHGGYWTTDQALFRSTNGGHSWWRTDYPSAATLSMGMTPDSVLFLTTSGGAVMFSRDSGATWNLDPTPISPALDGGGFTSYPHGILVGANGTILRTLYSGSDPTMRSTSIIDFGTIAIDSSARDSLVVTNLTSSVVVDSQFYSNNPTFSCSPSSLVLPPHGAAAYHLTFRPSIAGYHSGVMKFLSSTYAASDEVMLIGSGGGPGISIDRSALVFNNVNIGTNVEDSILVTNTGTATLSVTAITSDDNHFTPDASSMSLLPNERRTVHVRFLCDTVKPFSSMLHFTHNAASHNDSVPMYATVVSRVSEQQNTFPDAPTLEQSYPNPFTSQGAVSIVVSIGFTVPKAGPAQLALFGMNGQKIAVLYDGFLNNGHYVVRGDLRSLPPGAYGYTLTTGSTVVARILICQ